MAFALAPLPPQTTVLQLRYNPSALSCSEVISADATHPPPRRNAESCSIIVLRPSRCRKRRREPPRSGLPSRTSPVPDLSIGTCQCCTRRAQSVLSGELNSSDGFQVEHSSLLGESIERMNHVRVHTKTEPQLSGLKLATLLQTPLPVWVRFPAIPWLRR